LGSIDTASKLCRAEAVRSRQFQKIEVGIFARREWPVLPALRKRLKKAGMNTAGMQSMATNRGNVV
jgi:hypothetical protein